MALFLKDKIVNYPSLDIEQKILVDEFFKRFDIGPGDAYDVINVVPLFYEGDIAGSEFLTYNANKLYLCFDILLSWSGAASAGNGEVRFHDDVNAVNLYGQNNSVAYEAVAAVMWYSLNDVNIKNLYFSRFTVNKYNYIKFIGYRITY